MKPQSISQQTLVQPRWGQRRRLEFIDFRLHWNRTVNRSDLVQFFGVSIQQASADIGNYSKRAPQNLEYDKSLKTYRATTTFRSIYNKDDAQTYLSELLGLSLGTHPRSVSFIGWQPPHDVVRYPTRPIDTDILLRVIWAIRDSEQLTVSYQSMRRAVPTKRWISPHALAFDGNRWHVRAWCTESEEYRDFVISRIQRIEATRKASDLPEPDGWWNTYVTIVVRPRRGLTDGQRRAIETDYGMIEGRLQLKCRKALAFYLLRQMELHRPFYGSPTEQPLELMNSKGLEHVVLAAKKTTDISVISHSNTQENVDERTSA